jgi:hypothetical protein
MPKAQGDPFQCLEPRLGPPLNTNLDVGIKTNVMGVLMLGTLMEGKAVNVGHSQMETPNELGKYGVGTMALMDGKEDIT